MDWHVERRLLSYPEELHQDLESALCLNICLAGLLLADIKGLTGESTVGLASPLTQEPQCLGDLRTHVVEVPEGFAPEQGIGAAEAPTRLVCGVEILVELRSRPGEHGLEGGEADIQRPLFGGGLAEHGPQRIRPLELQGALGTTEAPQCLQKGVGVEEIAQLLLTHAPDIGGN